MPTVNHPTFLNVSEDVPEKDLQDWLDQGWLSDQIMPEPEPDPEPELVVDETPKSGPRDK